MFEEQFDRMDKNLDMMSEITGILRVTNKRSAGLEHEAGQPCHATEADVEPDPKIRKRTEDVSAADRMMNGDSSSARVDHDPMHLTSFGDDFTEPPAPKNSIDDALIDKGAMQSTKAVSPTVEMRTPTAASGLLPASTASTAVRTIFPRPLFSWSLGEETKEKNSWTNFNQLAPPSRRKVLKT